MRQAHGLCRGRRGLNAEPAIRLPGQKDQHTKTGTLTLQDARLPCDKRMAYAVVGGGRTLNLRLDSSVERVRMLGTTDGLCQANDSEA